MNETYKVAGYNGVAWFWTIGFIVAFFYFLASAIATPDTFYIAVTVLLGVSIVYGWIRSVRQYRLDDEQKMVIVERAGPGRIGIPFDKIDSAQFKPQVGAFFNVSFLSIGGLFGWAGKVRVRNPTDVRSSIAEAYGTNPVKSVVLELESGRTLILTPADPEAFASALQAAMPRRPFMSRPPGRTIRKLEKR